MTTYFHLTESMFTEREQLLLEADTLEAYAFRFASGVAAIRLRNELGDLVLLPFQGQQIWSASFRGRNSGQRRLDASASNAAIASGAGRYIVNSSSSAISPPQSSSLDSSSSASQ